MRRYNGQEEGLALDGIHPVPIAAQPVLARSNRIEVVDLNVDSEYVILDIPQKWLRCPITQLFSAAPLIAPNGDIYDGVAIRELIARGGVDPAGQRIDPATLNEDNFRKSVNEAVRGFNPNLSPEADEPDIRVLSPVVDDAPIRVKFRLGVGSFENIIDFNFLPVPFTTPSGEIYEESWIRDYLQTHDNRDPKNTLVDAPYKLHLDRFRQAVFFAMFKANHKFVLASVGDKKIVESVHYAIQEKDAELLNMLLEQAEEDEKAELSITDQVRVAIFLGHVDSLNRLLGQMTAQERRNLSLVDQVSIAIFQKKPGELSRILGGLTRDQRVHLNIRQHIEEAYQSRNEQMFVAFMKHCCDTVHLGDEFIEAVLEAVVGEGRESWAREILGYYHSKSLGLLREKIAPLNPEMAIALYETPEIRIKLHANKNEGALSLACRNEDEVIIQHCLNNPRRSSSGAEENALSVALSLGNLKVINLLLKQDPDKLNSPVSGGDTPIMKAILLPALHPLVEVMIKAPHFNWESRNTKTDTVFHVASYTGNEPVLMTLLANVPRKHLRLLTATNDLGQTPLSSAMKDHHACAERLIAAGAGVFTPVAHNGQMVSPLALTRVLKRKNLEKKLTEFYQSHQGDICDLLITRDYQCVNESNNALILPVVNEWLLFKDQFFEYLRAINVDKNSSRDDVDKAELICNELNDPKSPVRQFFELGQRTWGIWSSPWPAKFKALTEVLSVKIEAANELVSTYH